ncbi:unnamed protein product [Cochlearia groenlandica]
MASETNQLQQNQLATILGSSDSAPFETLISNLTSSSHERRASAESLFNLAKRTNPDTLSMKLSHLLQHSPRHERRAASAVLLRKLLTPDDGCIWPHWGFINP